MSATEPDDEFFKTPEGQFIATSLCYLRSAQILNDSEEMEIESSLLKKPILHLLSHGIELLLKVPLLASGTGVEAVRLKFGHNLRKLWACDANETLRLFVLQQAQLSWDAAAASGRWPRDDFDNDPKMVLEDAISVLSRLHSAESEMALRYLIAKPEKAPRPGFLIDVFHSVVDDAARQPQLILGIYEETLAAQGAGAPR